MLLIIFALAWVAIWVPRAVRYLRENRTERSIDSFHAEHEVLSRQGYAVEPAHRLDREDSVFSSMKQMMRRPRLQVVHADDTYESLESRANVDEWDDEFADDVATTRPSYARAYASAPRDEYSAYAPTGVARRRDARQQRRMIFTRLLIAAGASTLLAFVTSMSLLWDVAGLAWFGVVAFVAAAFYAVSQGWLHEESLPIRLPRLPQRPERLASVETLYEEAPTYEDEFDDEFYEPGETQWARAEAPRRAFG
jgi:hypothetical protein